MRPLRPEPERRVLAVAWKILTRGVRAGRPPSSVVDLRAALLARADLGGAPLDRIPDWSVDGILPAGSSAAGRDARARVLEALDAVRGLVGRLCRLYGVGAAAPGGEFVLPWDGEPRPPAGYRPAPCRAAPLESIRDEDLDFFLGLLFGKARFLPGQREAVCALLAGRDAVVLLPTGGGKSVVFQLAAMLRPGPCVVVEPTLSLIDDQLSHLAAAGIRRALAVTGRCAARAKAEGLRALVEGGACFCYVAPERFQTSAFRRALRLLAAGEGLGLAVVDEAHCVSEWGHDFRVAYLQVARILDRTSVGGSRNFPLAALTGTASTRVLEDLRRLLGVRIAAALVAASSPERPELGFRVERCRSREKTRRLAELLDGLPYLWGEDRDAFFRPSRPGARCGILFCPHVDGPFGAQAFAASARGWGLAVDIYHGKAPRGIEASRWDELKREAAGRFQRDEAVLLAATKAFGLGIDKPNIRYTVHLGLPASVESFYQEAGRAGRDRARALCCLLVSIEDVPRARWLLDERTSVSEIAAELESTRPEDEDDVVRALRLHLHAFRGPEREACDVREVLDRLGDIGSPGPRRLSFQYQDRSLVEKALYRLICLGIVEDYTVVQGEGEYQVVLSGQLRPRQALIGHFLAMGGPLEFVKRAGDLPAAGEEELLGKALLLLLEHTYATVERSRRASLREMLSCCLPGVSEEEFLRRVETALSVRTGKA